MRSELRIRTPEGIAFSYALAGPVTRCLAAALDIVCVVFFSKLLEQALRIVGSIDPDFMMGLTMVGYFVISICYGVVCEWALRGQTLGKRFLRLRVIDASGLRLQFHQVLLRNLLRPVDMLPAFYLLGGLVSLLGGRAQRLGDLAAGTIVIHQPKWAQPDLEQLLSGKFNSLRDQPQLAARLRQRTGPQEARLVLQVLLRRDEFDPQARVVLFAALATHFNALIGSPQEFGNSMPDEQFVRNVADILHRSASATKFPCNELRNSL
jgi:uncharacterized RDD family membrane protein YckC